MRIEARLKELGIELPELAAPAGNYVPATREGSLLFLAGRGPIGLDGTVMRGKVGRDYTAEQAYEHARLCGLQLIATLKDELGDLDRVRRILKVYGMVNAEPDFAEQPKVINGCSDLLVQVFGEAGKHARSAVGQGSLPNSITVEVELIAAVD